MSDTTLGDLLVQRNLMSADQLRTAHEFQKSLGGDLRNIVVKLGFVKDSVIADLVAEEEHVGSSAEITGDVIDFEAVKHIPRATLDKHQIVPLLSDGHSLVLAMADPNDLRAIEEVQFLVNRPVEPAVATKAAIRKALNQLPELLKQRSAKKAPKSAIPADRLKLIKDMPVERLIRAYIVTQIEQGQLSLDDLIARASKL